ncbi:MAG: 16S rRNA (cytosine(967)-C(5))-methyltransferase RsmB, partial [Oscillospiraceae bacterium]|nr:16S rRNA (cytosine(967)-C(5))-methyltransferase RsmB [Oscillospiraceae bacterium]
MINARKLAVDALQKVNENGGFSNIVLGSILSIEDIDKKDISFISSLVYGVLERKITLDYIIEKQTKRKINKLHPYVVEVLRIGIYQLLYMDKVPASAAVNESVKLIKKSKQSFTSGFVNAVLRGVIRNKSDLIPKDNTVNSLSIRYSCPQWLVQELFSDYGDTNTEEFLKDSLSVPPIYVRVNNLKITVEELKRNLEQTGIIVHNCNDFSNTLYLEKTGNIEYNNFYKNGYFHVQDLSSQLCVKALDVHEGDRVLDICSAPGGKSFTSAEIMKNAGEIVACDLYDHRVKLIQDGANRLGISIIIAKVSDATKFDKTLGLFDRVLCDAPCSGFGVIRRKPEIKYKTKSEIDNLPEIQFEILQNASKYLKKDGQLVYSTCTLRKCENDDVVDRFIYENPEFVLLKKTTLFPHINKGDGFFISVL